MTTTDDSMPPLRFWLQAAAGRYAEESDAALRSEALDRREWRLLKGLARPDSAAVQERLSRHPHRLERLTRRGWVASADDGWHLTDDGRSGLERIRTRFTALRERVSAAASSDDLAVTAASLEAIARELGWEEGQRHHRGRHREGHRPRGQHHPHEHGRPHPHGHGRPHEHRREHHCAPHGGRTLEG
ncbi:hypothetical protein QWJ90_10630 [Microbacterium oryzae]|uniref:hypothetical protein n=1 Tax=Microbacterium oryzae TaxID=743009 RepID=UPI0025B1CE8F|nr:hypothetical protein [Microbacterium oryzae]MDN3311386.1 hypothetical protein [Microbacterium oryzae]